MSVNKINNDGTLSPMAGTPALKLNGIQDNINKNGAKNLLPNRGTSYTAGNLTLTKNADGSVTLNGSNNTGSTVWWKFAEDIVWGSEDKSWEINGFPNEHTYNGYTFSLDGDSSVTIGTGLFYFGFTVANSTTWLGINTGASFSNLTVYPMVRLASDTDSTYQPYAMTNVEITNDITKMDLIYMGNNMYLSHTGCIYQLRFKGCSYSEFAAGMAIITNYLPGIIHADMYTERSGLRYFATYENNEVYITGSWNTAPTPFSSADTSHRLYGNVLFIRDRV